MTFRHSFASNKSRPLSAIFLGSVSSPNNLPDLPEPPPSPGAASNSSGLPSPPATNSTGSGSTGDDTTNFGSIRQRPAGYSHPPNTNTNMLNGNHDNEINTRSTTNIQEDDEDDEDDNDNDEDNTARIDRRRSLKGASQNIEALQRVKSLTHRNRMALDKLSSISRLSSPSPSPSPSANRSSRSPAPPHTAGPSSSTASSHKRISPYSHSHSVSLSHPHPQHPLNSNVHNNFNSRYREDREQILSGSDTEREANHRLSLASLTNSSASSDDQSVTPPSSLAASASVLRMTSISGMIPPTSPRPRPRRTSLPNSPAKALNLERSRSGRDEGRDGSPPPSKTSKRRPSTASASIPDLSPDYEHGSHDLTSAALAAVARSRTPINFGGGGSGSGKGKRTALPREFMGRDRRSLDGRSTGSSNEPQTPHRLPNRENTNVYLARGSPSPKASASTFGHADQLPPRSPRGSRAGRSSTVRELTRRHQTRWLSDDMSADLDLGDDIPGRRQGQRGGSAESPLTSVGGRSLVGEGLRAAGITTKRGDDVFSNGGGSSGKGADDRSQASGSGSSRVSEGVGPPSVASTRVSFDSRPNEASDRRAHRASYNGMASRPATSMAVYNNHGEDTEQPGTAPLPGMRTYKSAYLLAERDRDRHGIGSSIHARQNHSPSQPTPSQDRASVSPFVTRRHTPMTPLPTGSGSSPGPGHPFATSEHGRLMHEALQMFESHLSRLPPMGTTTTQTIPDLFRSAQNIVHASEKLNGLLRAGTNGALEEQIDAEVGNNEGVAGGEEVAEVWRRVGGELRESLRISDEVVRTMTGFLLGIGKVLKETASGDGSQQHARSASLDDDPVGRNGASPDGGYANGSGGRRSTEGRLSAQSRRSWEPSPRNQGDASVRRRPPSALNTHRDADLDREREPSHAGPSRNGLTTLSGTVRRLFTPREQREQRLDANTSLDSPNGYEPSPTPGSRQDKTSLARARTLPPLPMPPPLPSLPSESVLHHRDSNAADKPNRRKPSVASIQTIRGPNPMLPSGPTLTTAISRDDGGPYPLSRNDTGESTRMTNVTFSRPSTISVSALNGLHDQRKRTISTSSTAEEISTSVQQVVSPLSGSETERETRRSTVGARAAARMSLDGAIRRDREGVGNREGGRGQPPIPVGAPTLRRERRRTVTEIFR